MDTDDYRLLEELQSGLPLIREPFAELAQRLGMPESEILRRLRLLREEGIIRKFRARIDQRRTGFTANALVAWRTPEETRERAGLILAACPGVTHCYERQTVPGRWEYSLYTVHHGRSRDRVLAEVAELAGEAGLSDYLVLFSTQEFKRSSAGRIGHYLKAAS